MKQVQHHHDMADQVSLNTCILNNQILSIYMDYFVEEKKINTAVWEKNRENLNHGKSETANRERKWPNAS